MRSKLALLLLASAVGACTHATADQPDRGLEAVNVPVVQRADYVFDAAAPGGYLAPAEAARLDGWFSGLGLGYGDTVYVSGYSAGARDQIAQVAGNYGLLITDGAPAMPGSSGPDAVRIVVSRNRAIVPNCPNWSVPSQPNPDNRTLSNFGCAVNANLAAMVANPQDLIHGRAGEAASDGAAGAKAITMYRNWPLTGIQEGQQRRPLKQAETRKEDK